MESLTAPPARAPLLIGENLGLRYGLHGSSYGGSHGGSRGGSAAQVVDAVVGVSLTLAEGEILAIVGANGCGKSSLLRVLACLETAPRASGRVEYREIRTSSRSVAHRLAAVRALVPQRPEATAALTARQVVRLGRFSVGPDESAVDRALGDVGLLARAELPVNTLSGGERQRIAIARAFAQLDRGGVGGGVLLLDEPFSGIDPGEVARIVTALRMRARAGAVVLTSHDPGLARAIATHAMVMKEGRAIAFGAAGEVLSAKLLSEAYRSPMREVGDWIVPDLTASQSTERGRMRS